MDWDAVDAELRSLGKDDDAIRDVMDRYRPSAPLRLADVDAELEALAKGVTVSSPARKPSVRPVAAPVQDEDAVLDVSTKEVMIDMNFEEEASDRVRVSSAPPPPASRDDILDLLNQVSVVDDRGMDPVSVVETPRASVAPPAEEEFPEVIAEELAEAAIIDDDEFETIERDSLYPVAGDVDEADVGTAPRAEAAKPAVASVSPELSVEDDDDDIPSLEDRLASLEAPGSEGEFEMLVEDEFVSFDQTGTDDAHAAADNPPTQPDEKAPSQPPPATEARPSERKGLFKKIFGD